MDGDRIASLIYLGLLGAVLVTWFLIQNRQSMNRLLQQGALWALIFVGAVAAIGLWEDIRSATTSRATVAESGEITIPRAPDGHYYLTLGVNGSPIRFVVDTGATDLVLARKDAEAAGIDVEGAGFYREAATANGRVRVAPVTLSEVTIGPLVDRDVPASVNEGEMAGSLLGMSYLQRFGRIEIAGGKMILTR